MEGGGKGQESGPSSRGWFCRAGKVAQVCRAAEMKASEGFRAVLGDHILVGTECAEWGQGDTRQSPSPSVLCSQVTCLPTPSHLLPNSPFLPREFEMLGQGWGAGSEADTKPRACSCDPLEMSWCPCSCLLPAVSPAPRRCLARGCSVNRAQITECVSDWPGRAPLTVY